MGGCEDAIGAVMIGISFVYLLIPYSCVLPLPSSVFPNEIVYESPDFARLPNARQPSKKATTHLIV
jgi:hypothetical protein